jgi:hypothetical protein
MATDAKLIELGYAPRRLFVPYRANFWRGLVNRWDKALAAARAFQKEQGALPPAIRRTIETGIGGGIASYALWDLIAAHPLLSAVIAVAAVALAVYGWRRLKAWREKPATQPTAPVPAIIKDI